MLEHFEKRSSLFWIITGSIFVVSIGVADILTGSELAFSLFYLIPIVLVTWFSGRNPGLVVSVTSAGMWFVADVLAGQSYTQPVIRYWNAVVRLGFFVVVALLLPALKALEREKDLARTDYLTGVANRRYFFEVAQTELERSQRYKRPFTIAYIDLDGFKTMNDQWGHRTGDKLLRAVVSRAKRELRKTDFIARLGGDEFTILLLETDQDAAQIVIPRIQNALTDEMRQNDWPVTFSIGVLTCLEAQITTDELIKRADSLMYSVKKNGKNAIAYAVYAS
jgi:diguanylate cyclase (GGDEF)-like protein